MRFLFAIVAVLFSLSSVDAATITPAFGKWSSVGGSVDAGKQNVNTMQVLGATFSKPAGKPTMTIPTTGEAVAAAAEATPTDAGFVGFLESTFKKVTFANLKAFLFGTPIDGSINGQAILGVTPGYATIDEAITTAAGAGRTVFIQAGTSVSADLAIPTSIELIPLNGAVITIASGKTITFSQPQQERWPETQMFAGAGTVVNLPISRPEWFAAPGTTDMGAAINKARAAMNNPGLLVLGPTYSTSTEILIPYGGVNGGGVSVQFNNTQLLAMADNMTIMRWSDCKGKTSGSVKFSANGHTGVTLFKLAAEDEAQTATVTNQNHNRFMAHMEFSDGDEAMILKPGAHLNSGCYYNVFSSTYFTSVKRAILLADSSTVDDVAKVHAGSNTNTWYSVTINGSTNTAIQIDAGGGNTVYSPQMEQIALGTSPSTVPVGIKVANTMINGGENNNNTFILPHWEAVTQRADINNATTILDVADSELVNSAGTILPFTRQYQRSVAAKGAIVNEIFKTVTNPANIKGLWIFDEYGTAVSVPDRGTLGHTIALRDGSLVGLAASEWGPTISGNAPVMTYGDESHLWDTVDHADFSFGNGATDTPFSIVSLVSPTLSAYGQVVSKDSILTGATQREYALALTTAGAIRLFLFDDSAGSYIGRKTADATVTANEFAVLTATYSGSGAASGVKLYHNSSQVDNADFNSGVYTAMENKTAVVGSYSMDAAGAPTQMYKGKLSVTMIVAEELTAVQVRQLSYLLNGYAGNGLK